MEIFVNNKRYHVNPDDIGGVLAWMSEENLDSVHLPIETDLDFETFLYETDCSNLSILNLVVAFKIADFLNSKPKMEFFGRALAKVIETSSYDQIREISKCFE